MKRKINLIEAAMKFPQVPIAITVIMVLAGLISLLTMPRSEDPRITVRQGLVVAFYPGSDEEQIEKEVTDKLEQYLFGFEEIKKENKWNPPAEINEYDFQGKTVYLINSNCCDQYNNLVDSDCQVICAPSGGITGKGDGKCSDFTSVAKHTRLIWKDDRE